MTETVIPAWTVGDRLRKARQLRGLTQAELQDLTGISRRTIVTYEEGDALPRRPMLLAWAEATGVDLDWLATGSPATARYRGADALHPLGLALAA